MKTARMLLASVPAALLLVVAGTQSATAQVVIDPTSTPVLNKSATGPLGPLPSIAALMFALGAGILIMLVISYMRFAPRFSRDEDVKVVRADRVHLGQELPRRAVDISQASQVVVAPPPVPGAQVAPSAPPPAPAPPAAAPAPAEAAPAVPAAEADAPAAEADTPAAPAAEADAPAAEADAPAEAAPAAPAAEADAPAADAPAAPAAPAAEERPEVSLDQEVFQQTLDELLAKGTDRRVAEGQARRAAMIAARKKAAGG
jgi:hypothetical protein